VSEFFHNRPGAVSFAASGFYPEKVLSGNLLLILTVLFAVWVLADKK